MKMSPFMVTPSCFECPNIARTNVDAPPHRRRFRLSASRLFCMTADVSFDSALPLSPPCLISPSPLHCC